MRRNNCRFTRPRRLHPCSSYFYIFSKTEHFFSPFSFNFISHLHARGIFLRSSFASFLIHFAFRFRVIKLSLTKIACTQLEEDFLCTYHSHFAADGSE